MDSKLRQLNHTRRVNTPTSVITMGRVVDTNDPHQMGRLRIACPMWGDIAVPTSNQIAQMPWAMYVSPFGGSTDQITRGANGDVNIGTVAYGMWNIPKLGANVLVMMLDGDPSFRMWMGCVYEHSTPHTMPHGRYIEEMGNVPVTSLENTINPLATNLYKGFGTDPAKYEWRSRAADYSVSAVDTNTIAADVGLTKSTKPDDKDVDVTEADGNETVKRNGYAKRSEPDITENENELTDGESYSSQVYSWVSPGFHGISMDDRAENCRMRFRTTTGHQILLDDTNERIYISTHRGDNWIEMDTNGNIDVHSERRVSIHSASDMNFTTGGSFRVNAAEGIHLRTPKELRIHAQENISIKTQADIHTWSKGDTLWRCANMHTTVDTNALFTVGGDHDLDVTGTTKITSGADVDINATGGIKNTSGADIDINAGGGIKNTSGGSNETKAGGNIVESASAIHMNGPSASPAGTAATAGTATKPTEKLAYHPNRVPQHEPWGRIVAKTENTDMDHPHAEDDDVLANELDLLDPESLTLTYDAAEVGRGKDFDTDPDHPARGELWHR